MKRTVMLALCLFLILSVAGICAHGTSIQVPNHDLPPITIEFGNRTLGNIISTVLFSAPIVWFLIKKRHLLKKWRELPDPPSPNPDGEIPVSAYALHESPFEVPNSH